MMANHFFSLEKIICRSYANQMAFPTVDGSEIQFPTTWNGAKTL